MPRAKISKKPELRATQPRAKRPDTECDGPTRSPKRLAAKSDFRCALKAATPLVSPWSRGCNPGGAEAATLRARQLESALGSLSGELKKIQGGGSDLFKGPLMPFSKTAALQASHSGQAGRQASTPAASGAASKALRRLEAPRAAGPAVSKPPVGSGRLGLAPASCHFLHCVKCRWRCSPIRL